MISENIVSRPKVARLCEYRQLPTVSILHRDRIHRIANEIAPIVYEILLFATTQQISSLKNSQ